MELVSPLISIDWTLLMILASFVVLYLILKKFFFEKVRNFMLAREQTVKNQFDDAEAANKLANELYEEYENKLKNIEEERKELLRESKNDADVKAKEIIDAANKNADLMIEDAKKAIERERQDATEEIKTQISMLALYAAEKILEQKLDAEEQQVIIDKAMKEVSAEEWAH